jgi:hypothetical protein
MTVKIKDLTDEKAQKMLRDRWNFVKNIKLPAGRLIWNSSANGTYVISKHGTIGR